MSEVSYIKVWCEYDFNGNFGGNNNEEVFIVPSTMDIETKILNELMSRTLLAEDELEDLWDWEFIEVKELK